MQRSSPMLERNRKAGAPVAPAKAPLIPKRGRIRIVLVLIAIALFAFSRQGSTRHEEGRGGLAEQKQAYAAAAVLKQKAVAVATAKKISSHGFTFPKLFSFHMPAFLKPRREAILPSWGARQFARSDISEMLKSHSSHFGRSVDTVSYNGRSMALAYSLDTALQKTAESFLRQYHPLYGAVCVMEPSTGRVLALVSYTREGAPSLGDNLYARSIFPAASTFKTITAAGVVEALGYTSDSPVKTSGPNHTLWRQQLVQNPRYTKNISLEEAFAYSINPAFARMGVYLLGSDGLDRFADRFGFNQEIPFELNAERPVFVKPDSLYATAEVASGYNQRTNISPLFGAMIAASIANGGRMMTPTLVDRATDAATGRTVYSRSATILRTPVSSRTAGEIVKMMEKVPVYGTARKGFRLVKQTSEFAGMSYGGKTGNVDKDGVGRTDWFIGYARDDRDTARNLAVGVVTMHDAYWTVHSSYIAAELMRYHVRNLELARRSTVPHGEVASVSSAGNHGEN